MRISTIMICFVICGSVNAAEPQLPERVKVKDFENDKGEKLRLLWGAAAIEDDEKEAALKSGKSVPKTSGRKPASTIKEPKKDRSHKPDQPYFKYVIERKSILLKPEPDPNRDDFDPEAPLIALREFEVVAEVEGNKQEFVDKELDRKHNYVYRIKLKLPNGTISDPSQTASATPVLQWVDQSKLYFGLFMLVVCGSVVYFIEAAKAGKTLKIRKIAGLEAIEEAVGRATEMGRDCLFIPGIQDINDIQTVAGITVLSRVAELTAEYDAGLDVPTTRSLVMTVARETVDGAYTAAGRPDLYNPDNIYYVTDEQFGFVAAVTGKMVREKPAACFYMGAFYAESLIFAETANTVGAIQIAGTAMPSQLPFFVAACDYVLIGEEFFAASAYLSGEPQQLGSLKGQDVGKFIAGLFLILGAVLMTVSQFVHRGESGEKTGDLQNVISFITESLLGT